METKDGARPRRAAGTASRQPAQRLRTRLCLRLLVGGMKAPTNAESPAGSSRLGCALPRTCRVAGYALLPLSLSRALTFEPPPRQVVVGAPTLITWTSDPADPPVWVLAVTTRNGHHAVLIQTVDASAGELTFVFPTVHPRFRPVFSLQTTSGSQILAITEPFFVTEHPSSSSSSVDPATMVVPLLGTKLPEVAFC